MKTLDEKLDILRRDTGVGNSAGAASGRRIRIMIMGLGSVGLYLLDYLLSTGDQGIEICVAGRNREKMVSDVNIVKTASSIRHQNRTKVSVRDHVDFDDVDSIVSCIRECRPDIIVNASRVYPGLKYGSISWNNVRAYGIWAPLAVKHIKNIMEAYEEAQSNAVVINTSYSDAVIPWLKSAGKAFPDFGSGNINHLIPRIQFSVARQYAIEDYWNIDVTYAVSHFHDVVISKEGQTEGVSQLICLQYKGKKLEPDMDKIFEGCKIPMPTDTKRNMMNASSNFEIISGILSVVREQKKVKLHCPGIFGEIGGYPLILDGTDEKIKTCIDVSCFDLESMRRKNRESIYLDGIKNVENGVLTYTDELIEKCRRSFGISLMHEVTWDKIEEASHFLIEEVISHRGTGRL